MATSDISPSRQQSRHDIQIQIPYSCLQRRSIYLNTVRGYSGTGRHGAVDVEPQEDEVLDQLNQFVEGISHMREVVQRRFQSHRLKINALGSVLHQGLDFSRNSLVMS